MSVSISLVSVVLDCSDPKSLKEFYRRLLDWPDKGGNFGDEYMWIENPCGGPGLAFQIEEDYVPPVWPDESGRQGKMMHLDFHVDDLSASIAKALELGAREAAVQFLDDEGCHVMIDPVGHPFCLIRLSEM